MSGPAPAKQPVGGSASSRATPYLVGLVIASLLASFALLVRPGERSGSDSLAADGYSRSAVGHIGFLELLRARGERVVQRHSLRATKDCGLLVFAEPGVEFEPSKQRLEGTIEEALVTLIVLGKRQSVEADPKPGWSKRVDLVPQRDVERVFRVFTDALELVRPDVLRPSSRGAWITPTDWPLPEVPSDLQLLGDAPGWVPVVWCQQGILLAQNDDRHDVYVLSDPDLIANHGLLRGRNAELVDRMLERMHPGGPIVVDESLHGHVVENSIWEALGRYPFVFVTCHLLVLLALCGWIAIGRHGSVEVERSAIDPGKGYLIDNVASLIAFGGNPAPSLRRYARIRLHRLAAWLRAPRGLDDAAVEAFVLERLPAERGEQLKAALRWRDTVSSPNAAVQAARRIQELTEGT